MFHEMLSGASELQAFALILLALYGYYVLFRDVRKYVLKKRPARSAGERKKG